MAQVNFRMDDALKAQADAEFRQMGLTFSAAITLLCTQVVLKHRLPFAIEAAGAAVRRQVHWPLRREIGIRLGRAKGRCARRGRSVIFAERRRRRSGGHTEREPRAARA